MAELHRKRAKRTCGLQRGGSSAVNEGCSGEETHSVDYTPALLFLLDSISPLLGLSLGVGCFV